MVIRTASKIVVCFTAFAFSFGIPSLAQARSNSDNSPRAASDQLPSKAKAWNYDKDFAAVVVAPDNLSLPKVGSFPVWVDVSQLGDKPIPDSIELHCNGAVFDGANPPSQSIVLKTRGNMAEAFCIVPRGCSTDLTIHFDVTSVGNPSDFFGTGTDVHITPEAKWTIVTAAGPIAADGKSAGVYRVKVLDADGKPISGDPFEVVLTSTTREHQYLASGVSDDQGVMTFHTPASTVAGRGWLQFLTETLVTVQIPVTYVASSTPPAH